MRILSAILLLSCAAMAAAQTEAPPTPVTPPSSPPTAAPATKPAAAATQPQVYGQIVTADINPPEQINYRSTNRNISAYYVTPKLSGKVPSVIYIHDIFGTTAFAKAQADALARQGYAVLMPNLYSRVDNSDQGFDAQNAWIAYDKTPDPQVMEDLRGALEFLQQEGKPTAGQPLAVVGHDMGGIYAMRMASNDLRVAAAVNYYGRIVYTNTTAARPTSPVEDLFNLQAPLLSFYGDIDPQIPRQHIRSLESRLQNNPNKTYYELVRLPNVGHGFLVPTRQGYNQAAAAKAEAETRTFLARYLRAEPRKLED